MFFSINSALAVIGSPVWAFGASFFSTGFLAAGFFLTGISTSTPIISPIFPATLGPPGAHNVILAPSWATPVAYPEHPGYPQAPQFTPGNIAKIASTLGSFSTSNFFEAYAKNRPINTPVIPITTTGIKIASIFTSICISY